MKTYCHKHFFDIITNLVKDVKRKQRSPIEELKTAWFMMPDFLKNTRPTMIKSDVLFISASENGMILQFQEAKILENCRKVIPSLKKIKILSSNSSLQ